MELNLAVENALCSNLPSKYVFDRYIDLVAYSRLGELYVGHDIKYVACVLERNIPDFFIMNRPHTRA